MAVEMTQSESMTETRRKVLLVDDSKTFQSIFRATLATTDCELFVCSDGRQALDVIGAHYIDFVCASFYLPDMEGIDLCLKVRHLTKQASKPFVLLTSVDIENTLNKALPAGVTDIFHRSDVAQLLAFIKRFPSSNARIKGHVLYVEDNKSQRAALKAILEHRGLSVEAFASADEAWQHFQKHDCDLVLTDVAAQMKFLTSIGCEKIQGYLLSKPLPADQAKAFIMAHVPFQHAGDVDLWRQPGD